MGTVREPKAHDVTQDVLQGWPEATADKAVATLAEVTVKAARRCWHY
jgi:hypothetical protein